MIIYVTDCYPEFSALNTHIFITFTSSDEDNIIKAKVDKTNSLNPLFLYIDIGIRIKYESV